MDPQVVIVGSGIAGLTAAALFSQHANVILIEKDKVPSPTQFLLGNPGTPQDRHVHYMFEGCRQKLELIFPGFTNRLVQNGARCCDRINDASWFQYGWKPRFTTDTTSYLFTRPVLDETLRQCLHLKTRKNNKFSIRYIHDAIVTSYIYDKEHHKVSGVYLLSNESINASLVVDACGKYSIAPKYFSTIGHDNIPKDSLQLTITYLTMMFEYPPDYNFSASVFVSHPHHKHEELGCQALVLNHNAVYNGRHGYHYLICTIQIPVSYTYRNLTFSHQFSSPLHHFRFLLTRLKNKNIYFTVIQGKSIYPTPWHHTFVDPCRYKWDAAYNLPSGLLSVGDAACSFNPIYMQGMTHAVTGLYRLKSIIKQLVRGEQVNVARQLIARESEFNFYLNTCQDLHFPHVRGLKPAYTEYTWTLLRMVMYAETQSRLVHKYATLVRHFQNSPLLFLNPLLWIQIIYYHFTKH